MPPPKTACPICGESSPARVRKIVVEGRDFFLCQPHATVVLRANPSSIEELKALVRREVDGTDRRSPIDRRGNQMDRRVFPRPEGRRMGRGRRANDPCD